MFIPGTYLMPTNHTMMEETHKFRWERNTHLNRSVCAFAPMPPSDTVFPLAMEIWNRSTSEYIA